MHSPEQLRELAEPKYLLVKRGLYYGPDNRGYTGIKDRAGRYPATGADELSGITAIHEDDAPLFAPKCFHDIKVDYLLSLIAERDREIASLKALASETANG